jgi:hypothetical protein
MKKQHYYYLAEVKGLKGIFLGAGKVFPSSNRSLLIR